MNKKISVHKFWLLAVLLFPACSASTSLASTLDTIGVTLLRTVTTNLNGGGVRVAQSEADASSSSPAPFEVNPAAAGFSASAFTYFNGPPTSTPPTSSSVYPNSVGAESGHADGVAQMFYGFTNGVSTNAAHVDNYEGSYFFITVVPGGLAINDPVVNQSFIATTTNTAEQQTYDLNYDAYAAQNKTLFVSAVGDGGGVNPPSTCYNGIGVGAYQGGSSTGPTPDNGRAKPDITAPADATSYSTPEVAGAATVLIQAAVRGDGGNDTNSAADPRLLKALLLNGAIKPADWANPTNSPLDTRYGSGILNLFNSYKQLSAGKHGYIESGTVSTGAAHPPLSNASNVIRLSGWDFNTNTSTTLADSVNHYYFNLVATNATNATFTGTITLAWNRQAHQSSINNLYLYLYNVASGSLKAASISTVDNIQHVFVAKIPPGRYDLQVLKKGGSTVSAAETYALAYEFFALPLAITRSGSNALLSWPIYPTGFSLQSTSSLSSPAWSGGYSPVVSNNQNIVTLPVSNGRQFFRLIRP